MYSRIPAAARIAMAPPGSHMSMKNWLFSWRFQMALAKPRVRMKIPIFIIIADGLAGATHEE